MRLAVDIFVHFPDDKSGHRLERIEALLHTLIIKETHVSQAVDDLLASLTVLQGTDTSILALLVELRGLLADPADVAKIQQAKELVNVENQRLLDALNANPATP